MRTWYWKLLLPILLWGVAACDPLTPQVTQQVIVVTNSPPPITPSSGVTPIPPSPRPIITPTPTLSTLPTATVPPCNQVEGIVLESRFNSTVAGNLIPYNIYLPPCFFESGRRYPYVILLHGSTYDYTQWADLGLQAAMDVGLLTKTFAPMVIVMPEGGLYEENNVFDVGNSFEDIILTDLIPHLESNFCLIQQREGRAIGGISRGGFWAFSIGLRHADVFSAIGGHSPFFSPDNAPITHNPLALAESAVGIENLRIYLDNSQSDLGGPNTIVFSNSLRNRGVPHQYVINPVGEHDNTYWSDHLNDYLAFYGANWIKEAAGLPSCQA